MSVNLKRYKVTSHHNLAICDYEHGTRETIHNYELSNEVTATNWKNAVREYFEKNLHFKFNIDNAYIDEDSNNIKYSNLVNIVNLEASDVEIKRWKENKERLYINNTIVTVEYLV